MTEPLTAENIRTGVYWNNRTCEWQAWAVNRKTRRAVLLGGCSGYVPREGVDAWEREVWHRWMPTVPVEELAWWL